jgi:UDP-N-acetylmuramoylalanine--D-glutamate ligase
LIRGRVVVAGIATSGAAVADALLDRGADVVVVDGRDGATERAEADRLLARGASVRLGDAETPVDADLVVTSPGWRPTQPLLAAALGEGIEVIGEPELAWRLQTEDGRRTPWLGVTGTNGKTTTVGMLEAILRAAGYRSVAAGNVGLPLVTAVLAQPSYDVLAVEMSSFQLHWSSTIAFDAAVVLNVAEDHIDWHGSMDAYAADKAKIWGPAESARGVLFNADDDWCRRLATPYADRHGFTLSSPEAGEIGVDDGFVVDAIAGRGRLLALDELPVTGDHNVANAVAAAGVASLWSRRGAALPDDAVASGLRAFRQGRHRSEVVGRIDEVAYVDDSKATNPHAADASLGAYGSVVWIVGGLFKGADVAPLVVRHTSRLQGVVAIGVDRRPVLEAMSRHAPDVPVVEVRGADTDVMEEAVAAAGALARPGDTVLLAPAAASMDQFRDYAERGDRFADAVRRRAGERA